MSEIQLWLSFLFLYSKFLGRSKHGSFTVEAIYLPLGSKSRTPGLTALMLESRADNFPKEN
jgi:hypothetical protein